MSVEPLTPSELEELRFIYDLVDDPSPTKRLLANIAAIEAKCDLLSASLKQADGKNDELLAACKAALAYIPGSEVRNWPPGFRLKQEALAALRKVIRESESGAAALKEEIEAIGPPPPFSHVLREALNATSVAEVERLRVENARVAKQWAKEVVESITPRGSKGGV